MLDRTQGSPIRPGGPNLPPGGLPRIQVGPGTNPLPGARATDRLEVAERGNATTELGELRALMEELETRLQSLEQRLGEAAPAPAPASAPALADGDWEVDGAAVPLGAPLAEDGLLPGEAAPEPFLEAESPEEGLAPEAATPGAPEAEGPVTAEALAAPAAAASQIQDALAQLDGGLGAALATKQREYETRRQFIQDLGELAQGAQMQGRSPAEQRVLAQAVQRLNAIATEVAKGAPVAQFAGEAFALKHRIADPAGSGRMPAANAGAQVYGMVAEQQDAIGARLDVLGAKQAAGRLSPAEMQEAQELEGRLIALDAIGSALGGAKLTGLSATGQQVAMQSIDRLGAMAEGIAAGQRVDMEQIEAEAHALGQALAAPNTPPEPAQVATGRDAAAIVAREQAKVRQKLAALDDRVAAGALPETVFADRANLMAQAEALAGLSQLLRSAKLDPRDPQARLIQERAMQQAGTLAEAMGRGVPASEVWDDAYVLAQTLADPFGSRQNPALQGVAALVGVAGKGARDLAQAQRGVQRDLIGGADPRGLDGKMASLNRAAEDLDGLRGRLSAIRLTGLNPAQEAEGARLAQAAQPLVQKLAQGKLTAKDAQRLEQLLQGMERLRHFQPGAQPPLPQPPVMPPYPQPPVVVTPLPQPPVVHPPQPQPPVAFTTYRTKRGDNLSKIAQQQLGDANRWREIVALNQDRYPSLAENPNLIFAGMELKLPKGSGQPLPPGSGVQPGTGPKPPKPPKPPVAPVSPPHVPAPVGPTPPNGSGLYTVKPGDTLGKIAASQLGDSRRWREIVDANRAEHPELVRNPDQLRAGWVLRMPGHVGPTPPVVPPSPPVITPHPQPGPLQDEQAVRWLQVNAGQDGRVSREEIERRMPPGPGKAALLRHYDAFLFGKIDPGQPGWTDLHAGDIAHLQSEIQSGRSLEQAAQALVQKVRREGRVEDQNGDGRVDEADLAAFAAKMRAGGTTPPVSPPTPPSPTPPSDQARLQQELEVFLNDRNTQDVEAVKYLFAQAPGHIAAATPAQRGRLLSLIAKGQVFQEEKALMGRILDQAEAKGDLGATLKGMSKKRLEQMFDAMEDGQEAVRLAGQLMKHGLYRDEAIWSAMDDEAARALGKHLGFREGLTERNAQLQALPEAMKHHLIRELESGWSTWGERYLAEWINLHVAIPYRFPPPPGQDSRMAGR